MRSTLVALMLVAAMTDRSVGKAPGTEAIGVPSLAAQPGSDGDCHRVESERSRWSDQYRIVLEHWRPFLDGHVERAAALDRIAVELAPRGLPISAPQEARTPGYRIQTEHLTLEWVEVPGSTEVEAVTAEATKLYERVAELLDERPAGRVTIVLGGPAEKPGGQHDYPRVDSKGRILLFKYVPDFHNYFSALAHEMVHAFRFDRRLSADWFFEEGFAEFVALRVDPSLAGLPWFDFSVTLVAGQWLAERQDIPLSVLRERHHELNLACTAQSYALRSAFFDWLGSTFGDRAVLEAAKESPAGALADYEKFFGEALEQLERDWRTSLLAGYRAIPDFEGVARSYRTESPIQYQPVCIAGEDF